jgi:hypothetical protein
MTAATGAYRLMSAAIGAGRRAGGFPAAVRWMYSLRCAGLPVSGLDPTYDKSADLGVGGGCWPAGLLGGVSESAH